MAKQVNVATEEFSESERFYGAALRVLQSEVLQAVAEASRVNSDHAHEVRAAEMIESFIAIRFKCDALLPLLVSLSCVGLLSLIPCCASP